MSSLKKDLSEPYLPGDEDEGLGLVNASFKWNEVEETQAEKDAKKTDAQPSPSESTDDSVAASIANDGSTDIVSLSGESVDHHFELREINVMFPEGELSVITGPTASGKTALLVCHEFGEIHTSNLIASC